MTTQGNGGSYSGSRFSPDRNLSRTVHMPDGRRRRVTLEMAFWCSIDQMLQDEGIGLPDLITMVETLPYPEYPKSVPLRLRRLVLDYYRETSTRPAMVIPSHRRQKAPEAAAKGKGKAKGKAKTKARGKGEVIPFDEFQRRRDDS